MLYAQIIAWTAVVYVAILTVISISCAIAKTNKKISPRLIALFAGLIICLGVMCGAFILYMCYVASFDVFLGVFFIVIFLFFWTLLICMEFINAID